MKLLTRLDTHIIFISSIIIIIRGVVAFWLGSNKQPMQRF